MDEVASSTASGRSAGKTAVERLMAAIGYPERMSSDSAPFALRVDGVEVFAEEMNGRLVLSYVLSDDEGILPTLAVYASGRMLREDATLAYGDVPGASSRQAARSSGRQAFIWQDAPADSDSHGMLRLFETFMDSCDWWRDRVDALRGGGESTSAPAPEEMMIRP